MRESWLPNRGFYPQVTCESWRSPTCIPRRAFSRVRASLCMNRSRACAQWDWTCAFYLPTGGAMGRWPTIGSNREVPRAVAGFEPDAIHVMYGGIMADQIARRQHFRPVVVTFHGSDLLGENLSGWMRRIISRYGVYCSRRAARRRRGRGGGGRGIWRMLWPARPKAGKVRVIPCGIDLERFKPMDPLACKHRLGWEPGSFHVLFASSNGDPVKRPWLAKAGGGANGAPQATDGASLPQLDTQRRGAGLALTRAMPCC